MTTRVSQSIGFPNMDFPPLLQKKMSEVTALYPHSSITARMRILEERFRDKMSEFSDGTSIYQAILKRYPDLLQARLIDLNEELQKLEMGYNSQVICKRIKKEIIHLSIADKRPNPFVCELVSLNLSSLNLTALSSIVFQCLRLQFLYLDRNQLRQLPSNIGFLKELKILNLSFNALEELPSELAELPLETLQLDHNLIPNPYPYFKSISHFSIAYNPVVKSSLLSEEIQRRAISDENLERVWDRIKQMSFLNDFHHKIDSATEIRWWMEKNKSLFIKIFDLDLSGLSLTEIPMEIVIYFPNLEELNISENQLTSLPEAFYQNTSLIRLILIENRISASALANLPSRIEIVQ